jgi:hypothetical protein
VAFAKQIKADNSRTPRQIRTHFSGRMVHEIARDVRRRVNAEMPAKEPVVKAEAEGNSSFCTFDVRRRKPESRRKPFFLAPADQASASFRRVSIASNNPSDSFSVTRSNPCECGRSRWLKTIYMPTLEPPLELVPVLDPLFEFDVVFRSILP